MPIDKLTYEKYQSLPSGALRVIVDQYVERDLSSGTDGLYAKVALTESKDCAFFTAERLCGLQKVHGAEYLSATCSVFPRVLNQVNGQLETSLYLSCPEAARNVLLHPDFMNAHEKATGSEYRTDQFSLLGSNGPGLPYKPYKYYKEVRLCVVNLLQDRSRPLWQRIFLVGMLSKHLDEIITVVDEKKLPGILESYRQTMGEPALKNELDRVTANPALQFDTVIRLADLAIRSGVAGTRFRECFQDFIRGVGYTRSSAPADDLERYQNAEQTFCRPFLECHPHIMENYLLNYVFRTLFPFGRQASAHVKTRTIFHEYLLMVSQYLILRGLLTGTSGYLGTGFGFANVVKLVQAFSKTAEHSPTYLEQILDFLVSRSLTDMRAAGSLLPR